MIPGICHFIWLGSDLHWTSVLAVRSAAARGGFDKILFHHTDDLSNNVWWDELRNISTVKTLKLDDDAIFRELGQDFGDLAQVYQCLDHHAARANVLRLALLFIHGGVYLDMDTITIRSLDKFRMRGGIFCGLERIVLPGTMVESNRTMDRIMAIGRCEFRDLFRKIPKGWKGFRLFEQYYHAAVNNAILGGEPGHEFFQNLLRDSMDMAPDQQRKRYSLGVHLLQKGVERYDGNDLRIYTPPHFFPLGPEISEHWFRHVRNPELDKVLYPETTIVHWYASVRTKEIVPQIDPEYVKEHAPSQLFSALASQFIE